MKDKTEAPLGDGDSWRAFERAVDAAIKSGPKPRVSPKPHEEMKLGKSKAKAESKANQLPRPNRAAPKKAKEW
jgi:hypothetical protein